MLRAVSLLQLQRHGSCNHRWWRQCGAFSSRSRAVGSCGSRYRHGLALSTGPSESYPAGMCVSLTCRKHVTKRSIHSTVQYSQVQWRLYLYCKPHDTRYLCNAVLCCLKWAYCMYHYYTCRRVLLLLLPCSAVHSGSSFLYVKVKGRRSTCLREMKYHLCKPY